MLSYNKKIKDKHNRKKSLGNNGFTLVEMIVTFVVLGILMSVSVMSLLAWQDWADFNRQNEYAETLFLSAQNKLSEYSANGTLGEFSRRAYVEENGNKVNLNSIYYADGAAYTSELNQENSVWTSKEAGTLCYAMTQKGDYAKYRAGESTASPTAPIVFELVEEYIYDTSILNETICIEFSLEDGQVFSVLFTDKFKKQGDVNYEAFEYNNENSSLRGLVNIATRYEDYRKDRMVGYYGVDTLSAALVSKTDKPTISKISLNNEETLNLSFKLGKYANATNQLTYDIGVVDTATGRKVLNIKLDTANYPLKNYENRQTVPCKVTRYVYGNDGKAETQEIGTYDILAYLDKDNQVRVVLDAVDVQATSYLYIEDFNDLTDADKLSAGMVDFADTLSFHRFGLSTEDIYCTVQGYGTLYKATSTKESNSSNVYFANGEESEESNSSLGDIKNYNYAIKNGRHLSNIRYMDDLDETLLAKYKGVDNKTINMTYYLINDIDWVDFVDGDNYYLSNASNLRPDSFTGLKTIGNTNTKVMTETVFASFNKLRMYDKFIGNAHTIAGLDINSKFNSLSGLYGYETNSQLNGAEGDTSGDIVSETDKPIGLFNVNYGSITNAKLDNIQVMSNNNKVGAFCGINVSGVLGDSTKTGVLYELHVLNSGINTDDASVIQGKEHVGGIVGYLQGIGENAEDNISEVEDIELASLINDAKVTGDKFVGGIVGEVRTSKTNAVKIVIKDCKNNGAVIASNTEIDANGEIKNKNNIDPSFAKYIGGITGYTANVYAGANPNETEARKLIRIVNCESFPVYSNSDLTSMLDADVDNAAKVLENKLNGVYVGGIVGYNYYGTIEGCTTKSPDGRNGYVFGYRFVGGIVGFNQGTTIKGDDSVSGINEANVVGCEYVGGITGCNADVDKNKIRTDALSDPAVSGIYNPDLSDNEILEKASFSVTPATDKNPENIIENWVNKGVIFATGKYAGGISGYNSGWIYNCNSEVESANVDGFFQSTYSNGDYAGGIAGYNNGIIGNTKRDSAGNLTETPSSENKISAVCYISGKNYVGGIVGYNDVDAIVEDYEIAGGYILGNKEDSAFVGGYAGFNSSLRLLVDDYGNSRAIISKPNRVVGEYFVGGSVGGNIINTYNVNLTDNKIPTEFKTDNFLGTIYGKAFVGGFVGYNMITDTSSLNYNGETGLDVSYVIQQRIVDGFTDSDDNKDKTDNEKLIDKVKILDSVGGLTNSGATMYISGSNEQMTQNSLGRIEADIFIGGVLGYNDENTKIYIKNVENTTPIIADEAIIYNSEQPQRTTDYIGRDTTYTYSYAGGIVGKVSENMTLDACSNASSGTVSTKGTYTGGLAEINEGVITNCTTKSFGKSIDDYVGGICGLNKAKGEITGCNAKNITISGRNVVAGISAENFGTISGSDIDSLKLLVSGKSAINPETGEQTTDGTAAGIAAYNAGTINLDDDINVNISSKGNYVGAATGINDGDGIIVNTGITGTVDTTAPIGSYNDRIINVTGEVDGLSYVGGLIGKNTSDNKSIVIAGFENDSVINAQRGTAGGIIGDNTSGNVIAFCDNYGVITATNAGNAGGITSTNNSTITKCNNYAEIKASSGMSGGIAAINNKEISDCWVYPKTCPVCKEPLTDMKCTNRHFEYGQPCPICKNDEIVYLDFSSKDAVGGISAINNGTIEKVKLRNVNVYNYTTSGVSNIGIITGINNENGKVSFVKELDENGKEIKILNNCTANTYTDNSFVGGIAGTNKGVIQGDELDADNRFLPKTIIEVNVGFMPNSASIASLGGVAGANYGDISNISIDGNVIGDLGSDVMGYGGIAGTNGYVTSKEADAALAKVKKNNPENDGYTAKITHCTFDGEVFGEGSGAGIALIGGITGNNAYGGEVEHCYIGVITPSTINGDEIKDNPRITKIYAGKQEVEIDGKTYITRGDKKDNNNDENRNFEGITHRNENSPYHADLITKAYDTMSYAYIGGIAGANYGRVASCDNYGKSFDNDGNPVDTDKVWVYSFISSSGGIVGYSYQGSFVTGTEDEHLTSGANWHVESRNTDNDRGNGGIIGYYKCTNDIAYCDNYADVECRFNANTSVGGVVGFINQSYDSSVNVFNCNNYGYVLGNTRTGGIVSHLSFTGIRFENCINYGTIRALSDEAAGILQCIWMPGYDMVFINCINHGNILSGNAIGSGFYAKRIEAQGGGSARLINCVNTGAIGRLTNSDTDGPNYTIAASTNMAGFTSYSDSNVYFTNCRNYFGYGNIYGLNTQGVYAKDCLDVSMSDEKAFNANYIGTLAKNYSGAANRSNNNYYVLWNSTTEPYNNTRYGVYTNITSNYHFTWTSNSSRVLSLYETPDASKRIRSSDSIKNDNTMKMDFDFTYDDSSAGMEGLVIYFANVDNSANNSNQKNEYSYILYDKNGNKLDEVQGIYKEVATNNSLEDGKVVIDFGAYKGTEVAKVSFETVNWGKDDKKGHYTTFHGFGYIPVEGNENKEADNKFIADLEPINNYIEKETNTSVDFKTSANMYIASSGATLNADDYQYVLLNDYLSELGGTNALRLYYNLTNYSLPENWFTLDYSFTYKDQAKGLDKYYFYLTTANGAKTGNQQRNYAYYAVFTDETGVEHYVGSQDNPMTVTGAGYHQEVEIKAPAACSGRVKNLKVYLKCTNNQTINISGFRWSEKDSNDKLLFPYNSSVFINNIFQNSLANELIYKKEDDKIKLYPNIFGLENQEEYGIIMENDIKSEDKKFREDLSEYDPIYDTLDGKNTWEKNTRVAVYKELDPKYEEFLYTTTYDTNTKLDTPTGGKITNKNGIYTLSWNKVKNATGYFTRYELVENGVVKYSSDYSEAIISADTTCSTTYGAVQIDANYKASGGTGKYTIRFYVKAISAYHRLNEGIEADYEKFDSDEYNFTELDALQILPIPSYHLEFITGNKAVIVIDNIEDYQAIDNYKDAIEIVFSSTRTIFDGVKTKTVKFTDGRAYSEPFVITNATVNQDTGINAYAQPTTDYKTVYMNSVTNYVGTDMMGSAQHADGTSGKLYVETITFLGFYGTQFEELKYNIQIAASQIEVYVVGDLVSQDETLGVDVAYDRGVIHSASRTGSTSYTTISLSGLPENLLEKDFEVRSYLYATQNDVLFFGHEVASGVVLEDVEDVKAITDENYFNAEGKKAEDLGEAPPSIYDDVNNKLKPGYVIYDNHDGTYDIYYSASLDADEQYVDAAGNNKTGHYQVHRMPYVYYHDDETTEALGYNYYIGKDVHYNGTNSNDTNIAKSKMVMTYPTKITETNGNDVDWSTGTTWDRTANKYRKNVKFVYEWIPTYEDERFDYQLKVRSTGAYKNEIRGSFSPNLTGGINVTVYYSDVSAGPTDEDINNASIYNLYITRRDQLVQPKPDIDNELVQGVNETGKPTYTFSWDTGKTGDRYEDAQYSVFLTGTTIDGEDVTLTTPQITDERSVTFTDTTGSWRYVKYTIHVTRLGTIDPDSTDGKTNYLPSMASKTCKSMLTMTQLPQPIVELHNILDATLGETEFDQDRQVYDVKWSSVSDAGEADDLGGYLITVTVKEPSDPSIVTQPHYYYIEDENAGNHSDTIKLDTASLMASGGKVIDLSSDSSSSYDETYILENEGQHKALIDLSDFNGNDILNITVKAIARTHSENYVDGIESEPTELKVHVRLDTPDIANNLMTDLDVNVPSMTISEINNTGFKLEYKDDSKASESGYYDIAIAVYDLEDGTPSDLTDEAAKEGSVKQVDNSGDGESSDTGYWNSGALRTLIYKSDRHRMSGNKLSQAQYEFKIGSGFKPADYAGKWIKVAIRARADSMISSWWTDEDPEDADTVNYFWIKIPAVKLDSPDLSESSAEEISYYLDYDNGGNWMITDSQATLYYLKVNKKTFKFNVVDYADGYELKYLGYDGQIQYVYLIPNSDNTAFDVYGYNYDGGELPYLDDSLNAQNAGNSFNPYTVNYGSIAKGESLEIPYNASFDSTVYYTEADLGAITLSSGIRYNTDNTVTLILPDMVDNVTVSKDGSNETKAVNPQDHNYTKQVTVQALISEDNEYYYISSPVNSWRRNGAELKEGGFDSDLPIDDAIEDIKSVITSVGVPAATDDSLDKKDDSDNVIARYYRASFTSNSPVVYRIRVTDSSGALVGEQYAVIADGVSDPASGYIGQLAILSNYVDNAGTYKLYISAAKITDANSISEWSDEWYFTKDGIGEKVQ